MTNKNYFLGYDFPRGCAEFAENSMFGQIREYARFVASLTLHLLQQRSCHHSCTTNTHSKTAAAAGFVLCKPPGDESDNKPANLGVFFPSELRNNDATGGR